MVPWLPWEVASFLHRRTDNQECQPSFWFDCQPGMETKWFQFQQRSTYDGYFQSEATWFFHCRDALSKGEEAGNWIQLCHKMKHLRREVLLFKKPPGSVVSKQRWAKGDVDHLPWKLLLRSFLSFNQDLSGHDGGDDATQRVAADDEGSILKTLISENLLKRELLGSCEEAGMEFAAGMTRLGTALIDL